MKQIAFIICLAFLMGSCKNTDASAEQIDNAENNSTSPAVSEDIITMRGNFIYHQDAAVLQTPTQIYGVVIDSKMNELDKQVQPFKKADTDMVSVTVKANRFKNPSEEGWPFILEIREILKVEALEQTKDVIQLAK